MSYDSPKGGEPGGAHRTGPPTPFEEATRRDLERNRIARQNNPYLQAREEKLKADLEKIRQRKAKRRERNPYDFS